jgi:hypothetical protein
MTEWNEAEWIKRVDAAKNMEEVRELMEEIPLDDEVSLALTDDPMSTFTALEIMSERSK